MDIEDASASWSLVLARSQLRIDSALDVLSDDLAPSSDERSYSVDGGGLIGLDVGADSAEWSRIERTERILARSLVVCLNGDETGGGNRTCGMTGKVGTSWDSFNLFGRNVARILRCRRFRRRVMTPWFVFFLLRGGSSNAAPGTTVTTVSAFSGLAPSNLIIFWKRVMFDFT